MAGVTVPPSRRRRHVDNPPMVLCVARNSKSARSAWSGGGGDGSWRGYGAQDGQSRLCRRNVARGRPAADRRAQPELHARHGRLRRGAVVQRLRPRSPPPLRTVAAFGGRHGPGPAGRRADDRGPRARRSAPLRDRRRTLHPPVPVRRAGISHARAGQHTVPAVADADGDAGRARAVDHREPVPSPRSGHGPDRSQGFVSLPQRITGLAGCRAARLRQRADAGRGRQCGGACVSQHLAGSRRGRDHAGLEPDVSQRHHQTAGSRAPGRARNRSRRADGFAGRRHGRRRGVQHRELGQGVADHPRRRSP